MNVDEAMLVAAKQGGLPETDEWHDEVIDALDVLSSEVERLRAELEKERIRLAACGVVAMSNTEDSLNKIFSDIHPDYLCASLQDVKTAVWREIKLRLEVKRLRSELAACQNLLDETRTELSICGAFHSLVKEGWQLEVEKVNRLEAELAAAKAASVCPVSWKSAEQFFQSGADRGNQWGVELWFENKEQREQFYKWLADNTPPTT